MDHPPENALLASPEKHFRLYLYAAVIALVRQSVHAFGSVEATMQRFPFLAGYVNELAGLGLEGIDLDAAPGQWRKRIVAWEDTTTDVLPLLALKKAAGLDYDHLAILLGAGLVDEDARFGALFTALHGMSTEARPTAGLLGGWQSHGQGPSDQLRPIRQLLELGVLINSQPDSPAAAWPVRIRDAIWPALRGTSGERPAQGLIYRRHETLAALPDLVLVEPLRTLVERLPGLLSSGEINTVAIRGPCGNGRRALLGAVARALGKGMLEIHQGETKNWAPGELIAPLAVLLNALPVFVLDSAPGSVTDLPLLSCTAGPVGVVIGRFGSFREAVGKRQVILDSAMPDVRSRIALWQGVLPEMAPAVREDLAERLRLPSGVLRRLASRAQGEAALAGHPAVTLADVQAAGQGLEREDLETLAIRVTGGGDWNHLVCDTQTRIDLKLLEQRCRHRERLSALVGAPLAGNLNPGVRALFKGSSGTGKTLAARLLAAALHKDLYRVDISAVVSKYIGETEKHLNRLLDRAEALDVILLFDEGDALFGQRTSVHSANDRYANLETNFLLQRFESHEGIVLVTTNLGEAIDRAFERRMDAVVEFNPPNADERRAIWRLHLAEAHGIAESFLDDLAYRCALSGGQIRNAVLHASLLAVDTDAALSAVHLANAVSREYRKTGAVCPLHPGG